MSYEPGGCCPAFAVVLNFSLQIQPFFIDIDTYPVKTYQKDHCDSGTSPHNTIHKTAEIALEEGFCAVAADHEKNSADDLVYHIDSETGEDTESHAVFLEELADRHAGGDEQDGVKDAQEPFYDAQKEEKAG